MKISSLIDIIGGRLLNQPSISFIYSFKTDASKVKEGDLFLAKTINDIDEAVRNGAFAIVLESQYPIIDKEIAWIKVENINFCIIQLLRYKLSTFELQAYYCKESTKELLSIFANSSFKKIRFLEENLDNSIKQLEDISNNNIIFSTNKDLLDKIYPNNDNFDKNNFEIQNLTEHSLFECSFTYNDLYFSKLKISSLYIQNFLSTYNFLNSELDLNKLKHFNCFKAIFLDKNLNITEFGKSDKFIITQNNKSLYEKEYLYFKNKYKYAKKDFISKTYLTQIDEKQELIKNLDEIKEFLLEKKSFNGVYLSGYSYEIVYDFFLKKEAEISLF